jgi:1,4-alpha-glucan branching enzyme
VSTLQFGALLSDSGVTFHLWAPAAREVSLVLDRKTAMPKDESSSDAQHRNALLSLIGSAHPWAV